MGDRLHPPANGHQPPADACFGRGQAILRERERFWSHLGRAHFTARKYSEAIEAFMHMSKMDVMQHAFLAAAYGQLGDRTAAEAHVGRLRALDAEFDLEAFLGTMHYADEADLAHLREGLLRAGIAEG